MHVQNKPYVMGDVVLRLHWQNGRCYVMRIQGDKKRLVYFGTAHECIKFMNAVRDIWLESELEVL